MKSRFVIFAEHIDWIHPSCRDLAIEELAQSRKYRQQFLTNCSEAGLFLACSLAGGATGKRQLPLLQNSDDWADFSSRAQDLIVSKPNVLRILWSNCEQIKNQSIEDPSLQQSANRLKMMIKDKLLCTIAKHVGLFAYSDATAFRSFFEISKELESSLSIDLSPAWNECLEDANRWLKRPFVIYQDNEVPGQIADFLHIIQAHYPQELQNPETRKKMEEAINLLLTRVEDESDIDYSEEEDKIRRQAEAFETAGKAFERISELPVWELDAQKTLTQAAYHLKYEAKNIRENLPDEEDPDSYSSSNYQRPSGEDMNISELFSDL